MVTNITSLTGNGLKDWLIQRITAGYFAVFVAVCFAFLFTHPHCDFVTWNGLFHQQWLQIAVVSAIAAYALHAWIGIWTVTTDYIHCTCIRLSVQLIVLVVLLAEFMSGLMIVWGR